MPITTPVSLLERLRTADFSTPDWAQFIQLYTPLILRWARGLKIQSHDAEDLAQDVLVHLSQALRRFVHDEKRGRFRDWLRRVTVRRWYLYARQRKLLPFDGDENELVDSDASDPARVFEEAEYRAHLLREALGILRHRVGERGWRACWATAAEGRPAREVAEELGMSEAAVFMAKSRVLRLLRRELQGFLD